MGHVVYLDRIPDCDFCLKKDPPVETPAIVDGQTVTGSWGYMCDACRKRWSIGGPIPPGIHPLENPIALRESTPMPTDEERDAKIAEYVANADMRELRDMMFDNEPSRAVDGCPAEPDGQCEHGYPSKLRAMGIC